MADAPFLIIGAGVTGLAFANFIAPSSFTLLERESRVGGYCKTVRKSGFVWDYSGHFFHFNRPEMEAFVRERIPSHALQRIRKSSKIYYGDRLIDFPFQKNIHQLPKAEFIQCLSDLYRAQSQDGSSFKQMLYRKFGQGIAEKFLIPYNEKLYACDLDQLDVDAMGRFFPYADFKDIMNQLEDPDNESYNSTFLYPRGGAEQLVEALLRDLPESQVKRSCEVLSIDVEKHRVRSTCGTLSYEYLISTAPLPALLNWIDFKVSSDLFEANQVLVFNLGFDQKGLSGIHWLYFPQRDLIFYRVGFYDNLFGDARMSLYVEIGMPQGTPVNAEQMLVRVLRDLQKVGIIGDHQLVAWHHVVLNPAYVWISQKSQKAVRELRKILATWNIYSIGRYGSWTYCSIEDNLIEAKELAGIFDQRQRQSWP